MPLGVSIFTKAGQEAIKAANAKNAPAPTPAGSGLGAVKKNILGQPIAAAPAASAKPASSPSVADLPKSGFGGYSISSQAALAKAAADNEAAQASPRSLAAKMMKRQAGIGQLKTMHTPTAEELL